MSCFFFLRIQLNGGRGKEIIFDKAKINESEIEINELIQEDRFSLKKKKIKTKQKLLGFIYQNSKDTQREQRRPSKERRKKGREGRKNEEKKTEGNSINIRLPWLSGEM